MFNDGAREVTFLFNDSGEKNCRARRIFTSRLCTKQKISFHSFIGLPLSGYTGRVRSRTMLRLCRGWPRSARSCTPRCTASNSNMNETCSLLPCKEMHGSVPGATGGKLCLGVWLIFRPLKIRSRKIMKYLFYMVFILPTFFICHLSRQHFLDNLIV